MYKWIKKKLYNLASRFVWDDFFYFQHIANASRFPCVRWTGHACTLHTIQHNYSNIYVHVASNAFHIKFAFVCVLCAAVHLCICVMHVFQYPTWKVLVHWCSVRSLSSNTYTTNFEYLEICLTCTEQTKHLHRSLISQYHSVRRA